MATGRLVGAAPSVPTSPASKGYVDSGDAQLVGINTQTVSYTLVASDAGKQVEYTAAAAGTFTVPPAVFPVGALIQLFLGSTGALTIAGGTGVTILSPAGLRLTTQYASAALVQRATNTWVLSGYTVT